jgi:hypothetical protein
MRADAARPDTVAKSNRTERFTPDVYRDDMLTALAAHLQVGGFRCKASGQRPGPTTGILGEFGRHQPLYGPMDTFSLPRQTETGPKWTNFPWQINKPSAANHPHLEKPQLAQVMQPSTIRKS